MSRLALFFSRMAARREDTFPDPAARGEDTEPLRALPSDGVVAVDEEATPLSSLTCTVCVAKAHKKQAKRQVQAVLARLYGIALDEQGAARYKNA